MAKSSEERITHLEIQLAHTERTCEQLNEVVTQISRDAQEQGRLIKRMVEQIKDLKNKADESDVDEDEKPPHY